MNPQLSRWFTCEIDRDSLIWMFSIATFVGHIWYPKRLSEQRSKFDTTQEVGSSGPPVYPPEVSHSLIGTWPIYGPFWMTYRNQTDDFPNSLFQRHFHHFHQDLGQILWYWWWNIIEYSSKRLGKSEIPKIPRGKSPTKTPGERHGWRLSGCDLLCRSGPLGPHRNHQPKQRWRMVAHSRYGRMAWIQELTLFSNDMVRPYAHFCRAISSCWLNTPSFCSLEVVKKIWARVAYGSTSETQPYWCCSNHWFRLNTQRGDLSWDPKINRSAATWSRVFVTVSGSLDWWGMNIRLYTSWSPAIEWRKSHGTNVSTFWCTPIVSMICIERDCQSSPLVGVHGDTSKFENPSWWFRDQLWLNGFFPWQQTIHVWWVILCENNCKYMVCTKNIFLGGCNLWT